MNIDGALQVASGGLANINRQLALVSQNVANANTPNYAAEIGSQYCVTAGGDGIGVRTGPTTRAIDMTLQAAVFTQNASVAGWQTRQAALQAIDTVQGTPGDGGDLASLLGALRDQFSALLNSADNQAQQNHVVSAAATLAQSLNTTTTAYTQQRQAAQDAIVADIGTLNTTLSTIGRLSDQIVAQTAIRQSTADLENQRDAAVASLSQLVEVKVLLQPNGDVLVTSGSGLILPTHAGSNAFSTSGANLQPGAFYPGGGVPAIMLGGQDVTSQLTSGRIGANIALRDVTLPTFQGELDELAQNLASRFSAQGLNLFTDGAGAVPPGGGSPVQNGYVGFAGTIQVNPAVQSNASLVRDGTLNPPTGLAGYTSVIQAVLTYTFGSEQSSGVPQPPSNTSGLGASGTLNAPYTAPTTLSGIVSTLLAPQAQESSQSTSQLGVEQGVQTGLSTKLASVSGVNIDTEMSHMIQLQNAYSANARVIATVQALWSQLLQSVQ